jgi:hypothetical protein
MVHRWKKLSAITKADVMAFAQEHLRNNNYAVVYKHTGEDKSVMKVDKPPITPIEVNRQDISEYAKTFLAQEAPDIAPQFLDFKNLIKKSSITPKLKLKSIQERSSQLFRLDYIFNMGRTSDRRLSMMANYLPFLGTSRLSPSALQQAFYRLGVHFSATCQDEHVYLTLSGLEESLEEGIVLMEEPQGASEKGSMHSAKSMEEQTLGCFVLKRPVTKSKSSVTKSWLTPMTLSVSDE